MHTCTFCQLVNHETDSLVVRESRSILFILPKDLEVFGHTLALPKPHYESLFDISDSILSELLIETKTLANQYRESLGATGINILHASGKSAQQSVAHFHLHIFPRFENDKINAWPELPKANFIPSEVHREIVSKLANINIISHG